MSTFSDLQLDALGELANLGSGTAAGALSSMLGRPVDVSVPNAHALSLADAVDAAGNPEEQVTAVALPVIGDLDATVVMLFHDEDVTTLCGIFGVEPGSEMGESALCEVGNILASSYLGALGMTTGVTIEPGPPQAATDMLGALVATILTVRAATSDIALMLDSSLVVEGTGCSLSFLLVPSNDSVRELLSRIGVS